MNILSAQHDMIDMELRQMGGTLESYHGQLTYIHLPLGKTEIQYVYNIDTRNCFYLQRLSPYPINVGTYTTQKSIIQFIKNDYEKLKKAYDNNSFEQFTQVVSVTHESLHDIDEAFLNYKIPNEKLLKIESLIQEIVKEIEVIRETCPLNENLNSEE